MVALVCLDPTNLDSHRVHDHSSDCCDPEYENVGSHHGFHPGHILESSSLVQKDFQDLIGILRSHSDPNIIFVVNHDLFLVDH